MFKKNVNPARNTYIGLLLMVLSLSSCEKYLAVIPPAIKPGADLIFSSDATAQASVLTLYNRLPEYLTYTYTVHAGLYGGDLSSTGTNSDFVEFNNSYIPPNNSIVRSYWQNIYTFIYYTNANIEGLQKSTKITASLKEQLMGEALFFRAYANFILVNTFTNVPLITTTNYEINATLAKSPPDEVYQQIINDLKDAQSRLLPAYPSANRVRVNKWAVTSLLARVYLYTKDYDNAIKQASLIIEEGGYGTLPVPESAFFTTSPEVILQIIPVSNTGLYNDDASNFIPSTTTAIPSLSLTADLVSLFAGNDKRSAKWIGSNVVNGVTYYYPAKYKNNNGTKTAEYRILLRLAELYLIRSEAYAQTNKLSLSIADVDVVRSRAGIPTIALTNPGIDQVELLKLIAKERRMEFFAELGHRWMDLKRTGQAATVLKALKLDGWKDASVNWPIPTAELELNTYLKQNPDY